MKRLQFLSILIALTLSIAPVVAEDSKAEAAVKAAVKALADQPNYSWVATFKTGSQSRFSMGPNDGWTEKGGWTHYITRYGDRMMESVFHGKKAALGQDGEWQTLAELEAGDTSYRAQMLKGFKAPAAEAAEILAKLKDVKQGEDGSYAGSLTKESAQGLLSRRGRRGGRGSGPEDAKGSVKFWVKDGVLIKFETSVQGSVAGRDGEKREVNRTTTVEMKGIGKSTVTVPEEVKKLLS